MIDNYDGPIFKYDNKLPFCINNIPMGGMVKVEYLNTIDGDTAYFKVGNTSESVRFYLINTPEVYNNEPYAKFAKEYTKQALENAKEIYIQSDLIIYLGTIQKVEEFLPIYGLIKSFLTMYY